MIAGMITVLALVIGVLLVVVAVMAQKNCCAKRELEDDLFCVMEARDDVSEKLAIANDKISKREARISDLELAIRGKIKDIEVLKADAQKRVAEVENALNLRNQEIEALKAKVAEHQAKYARYRCEMCGQIMSAKDYVANMGICKKCGKKMAEEPEPPMPEPVAEITPEQAKAYLTAQEAGEILKAGGEVRIAFEKNVLGPVFYALPDGKVGVVRESDKSREGWCDESVDACMNSFHSMTRFILFKAPPTKEADGTA